MWPTILLLTYCLLIVLASLAGGWLPSLMRLTHTRMQLMMSFVAGLMLGVALLHLLPHAAVELPSLDATIFAMLVGLLTTFFLIRLFHGHHHGPGEHPSLTEGAVADHAGEAPHGSSQPAAPDTVHGTAGGSVGALRQGHRFSWLGVGLGLALHSSIDGVALAASVARDARDPSGLYLFGLATFLAIVLHKPLDALSITSLMTVGGWGRRPRQLVNAAFAMMCPLGAALFWLSVVHWTDQPHLVLGYALAFSAGVFVCIAMSDLLPEVHFHAHDRLKLSAALLAGIGLAYAIGFFEPEHLHDHGPHGHHGSHTHDAHCDHDHP